VTLDEALQEALGHYGQNRLHEAELLCRRILETDPAYPDALHLLGLIAAQVGQHEIAADFIVRAIRQAPAFAPYHSNLGHILRMLGKLDEALAACREAVRLQPEYVPALVNLGCALGSLMLIEEAEEMWNEVRRLDPKHPDAAVNLGNIRYQRRQMSEAAEFYREALTLDPTHAEAQNNLAVIEQALGRAEEAERLCRAALAKNPNSAEAHCNLARALIKLGRAEEAEGNAKLAVALRPDFIDGFNTLAMVLHALRRFDESEIACRAALELDPDNLDGHNNLGAVMQELDRLDEAEAHIRKALAMHPDFPEARHNLGAILQRRLRLDEAAAECAEAVRLRPDFVEAAFTLSLVQLMAGDYEAGLAGYEHRWAAAPRLCRPRHFTQPLWDGETLPDKIVLIHAEQGFGDTIQFARFIPLAAERVRVIVECERPMVRLIETLPGIEQVIPMGDLLPEFDLQCPTLSLALAFGTTLETIPSDFPYLTAPAEAVEAWRARLADLPGLKVGLAWAGNPLQPTDKRRSIPAERLNRLAAIEGVSFVSLQKDAAGMPDLPLSDWTSELTDFGETAGLIEALDLVIAVDTAVVHLAGALAKPVWLLNRYDTDWRWLTEREDSPWYPTLRQFRQPTGGDWENVMERVADALVAEARHAG
jgi:tetratricopeptide (TPR) repeat protein